MPLGQERTCTESIFCAKSTILTKSQPAVEEEEEETKDAGIVIRMPETRYLPGERLLQRLNNKKPKKKKISPSKRDIDAIAAAMSRVVTILG